MTDIKDRLNQLVSEKNWMMIRREIAEMEPVLLAELLEDIPENDDIIIFRLLPREHAKETFQHLSFDKQEQIIEGLAQNVNKVSSLLNDLDPDDRTAFFEELPGQITTRLIQLLSFEERKIATKLLGYPEESIGRLMTPEYVAVKPHYTVAQTMEHIRQYGHDSETLNIIYIIDSSWKLLDELRIREIILAKPDQKISELMDYRFAALNAFDDQETAIRVFQDQDKVALPVVDREGLLLGIVTVDDVLDIVEEEATEDFYKFGSFQDSIINPIKERVAFLYRKRVVWLIILVFMNVFSGAALASFETVIQSAVSLIFFLPLLIASGGNAGAQSATMMIRSLANGDVMLKDWFKLIGKEFMVSLLLGITMAIGVSIIASFRAPEIIAVVAVTMILTVLTGSLIGLSLPFIFTKLKQDPATASAPLITSIADISGVVIYFTVASWYLNL